MAQNIQSTKRPDPIPERVGKGMFTDRETEMASLMAWPQPSAGLPSAAWQDSDPQTTLQSPLLGAG